MTTTQPPAPPVRPPAATPVSPWALSAFWFGTAFHWLLLLLILMPADVVRFVPVVSMQQAAGLASAMMILVNVEDARRDTIDATFDALVGSMRMGGPGRPALPTPQPGTPALDGLRVQMPEKQI